MFDSFNRHINYLRISVTDRCNLRCTYCMPTEDVNYLKHKDILSFEEIVDFVKIAVDCGITKVRITGGEPLVRKNIIELVSQISEIQGVEDLSMTTNGILLSRFAGELKKAGLKRVNISMDTLDEDEFTKITQGGNLKNVLKGIEAAKLAGLEPVKINAVKMKNMNKNGIIELRQFCKQNDLKLRFIHQMNLATGEFSVVEGSQGGNCSICNRLRLTANGKVKPCLFSDIEYDVRQLGAKKAIDMALFNKPKSGTYNKSGSFNAIGG